MVGYHSERTGHSLDLRASEVENHVKGQQVEVRFEQRMCRRFHPAIWCPWRTGAGSDPRCTRCAGWCNKEGCTPWRIQGDEYWARHCRWTRLVLPSSSGLVWPRMLLLPWRHHGFWSWVDEPRADPQSQVLSGVEVPEVLRVLDHMIVPVVGVEDAATCVRPANENVQERFDYKLMNEPYLLRRQPRKGRKERKTKIRKRDRKKKPHERRKMSSRDENCLVILHAGSRLFTQWHCNTVS